MLSLTKEECVAIKEELSRIIESRYSDDSHHKSIMSAYKKIAAEVECNAKA